MRRRWSPPRYVAPTGALGCTVAKGEGLERHGADTPTCRLAIEAGELTREDRFPAESDLGSVVILPGGEAGILQSWWNAPDGNAWRWSVEFQNRR